MILQIHFASGLRRRSMIDRSRITQAELDALFGDNQQLEFDLKPDKFYYKFITRVLLILSIWIIRIVVVSFFPEYHMISRLEHKLLSNEITDFLFIMRVSLFLVVGGIYFASFYTRKLFPQINAFTIVIVSCLIWSDFEMYILDNLRDLTLASLSMIGLRFLALILLIQNFIELQKRGYQI